MNELSKHTLAQMRDQLGGYAWRDDELEELINPRLGIITGFGPLLQQLEALRKLDLGSIPPAGGLKRR